MDAALLAARLLLGAVFLVSGAAKLPDRHATAQGFENFGLPVRLTKPLAVVVPLAELTVAASLLVSTSAWWSALGALALLVVFSAAIALNLARGRTPDCHCFGQLRSSPVGVSTLVRNGVLVVIALFVVSQGRTDVGPG